MITFRVGLVLVLLALLALSACLPATPKSQTPSPLPATSQSQTPSSPPTFIPVALTPSTPSPYELESFISEATLDPSGSLERITAVRVNPISTGALFGDSAIVTISFQQMILQRGAGNWGPWAIWPDKYGLSPAAEVRMCITFAGPCQLPDNWEPFVIEKAFSVQVDWLGYRPYWVTAQFRDSRGGTVLSTYTDVDARYADNPKEETNVHGSISGYYNPDIPIAALPTQFQVRAAAAATEVARIAPTETMYAETAVAIHSAHATSFAGDKTAIAVTQSALAQLSSSVVGAVKFDITLGEESHCCYGAHPGEVISFPVHFVAASPFAEIKEMRFITAYGRWPREDVEAAPWEPFVSEKTFTLGVSPNWVTFDIRVQYRDALGNVSPVYENYMSIEGW